jgi:hypothetical protein
MRSSQRKYSIDPWPDSESIIVTSNVPTCKYLLYTDKMKRKRQKEKGEGRISNGEKKHSSGFLSFPIPRPHSTIDV